MSVVTVSYLLVNIVATKVQGYAVYPGMTWDSVSGCMLPLGVAVAGVFLWWSMSKCSKFKDSKMKN